MAKLGILPLNLYRPGAPVAGWSDGITVSRFTVDTLLTTITPGSTVEAVIETTFESGTNVPNEAVVTLKTSVPSPLTIARINRLLDGLDAPRLETYFRQNTLVWRLPGTPTPIANTSGVSGMLTQNGWRWSLFGPALAAPAPVAPVAPVATPTLAPVAPAPAPVLVAQPLPAAPVAPVAAPIAATPVKVTPAQADTQKRGIFEYPQRSTTDVIETTDLTKKKIEATWSALLDGERPTLAMVGPAGVGKTAILDDLAADKGVGIYTFDGAGAASFDDWVGTTRLQNGQTRFVYSAFIEAIRLDSEYAGIHRIVRVDEVNRSETGSSTNVLMSVLQAGRLYIPGAGPDQAGETIYVDPAVLFAFTLNRGVAYGSTVDLDAALLERMQGWLRLDFLPEDDEVALVFKRTGLVEEHARPLVQAAAKVREIAQRGDVKVGISTRRVLKAAQFVRRGLTTREAAEFCWADSFEDEGGAQSQRGLVILAINSVLPA